MSYQDIKYHIHDMYGIEVATGAITAITDQLIPELEAWQQRPLDAVYPIVWMDAIHYKIREEGRYISKAIYTLLGLTMDGEKEILGIYLSDNESVSYWLSVLTELQNRGLEDIFIACIDGLSGFPDVIASLFPGTEIQLCIIHQIRNSMKYVASKNQKSFMVDLKSVYRAASLDAAETALDALEEKWGDTYPIVIKSWGKKWTMLIQNWSQALSQLDIYFEGRLNGQLNFLVRLEFKQHLTFFSSFQ